MSEECRCPEQYRLFPMDPPHSSTCPLGRLEVFVLPRSDSQ
ncbi:hypothetical protein [Streptosporangium oxazolinicum]